MPSVRVLTAWLYALARALNDINAVRSGRVARRLGNKAISRNAVARLWLR